MAPRHVEVQGRRVAALPWGQDKAVLHRAGGLPSTATPVLWDHSPWYPRKAGKGLLVKQTLQVLGTDHP